MTLPSSGTLTTAQVAEELYGNSSALVDLTGADARTLIGKPTGSVVFPDDFWGKSSGYTTNITTVASGSSSTYDRSPVIGSISPAYANIDGSTNTSGAAGQIDYLNYQQDEGTANYSIVLEVSGSYSLASLPFTAMRIHTTDISGNPTYIDATKSAITSVGAISGGTRIVWPPNYPRFTGTYTYEFI